jgi:predicted MFS family arabinose efflux permease
MRSRLDTPQAIASMIVLVVVGAMFFLLMPMYIGALADFAHFGNEQIGNLTFFELIGVASASLTSLFWIRRADWRYGVVIACIGLMAANGLSLLNHEFNWLAAMRVLAGLSEGALLCIAYAALGDTKEVDRNFGYAVIAQILAPAVFFVLLPGWFEQYGLNAIFYVQIGCAALALITVISLPANGIQRDAEVSILAVGRFPIIGLLGSVLFFIGVTAVWGFVERIGTAEGFSSQVIANVLAVSLFASVFGAVIASTLGVRYTRHWPMVVALVIQLIALTILVDGMSLIGYAVAIIVYSVGWNLWMPYQLSAISQVDNSGRIMGVVPLAQAFGVSLGPLIAGQLLSGESYIAINWMGAIFGVLSLLLFIPVCIAGQVVSQGESGVEQASLELDNSTNI